MIDQRVSLDLMEFVETQILPRYNAFDKAHNLVHANRVISRSLELARKIGADMNMAYPPPDQREDTHRRRPSEALVHAPAAHRDERSR